MIIGCPLANLHSDITSAPLDTGDGVLGFKSVTEVVLYYSDYGIPNCIESRANMVKEHVLRGLPGGFRHVIFVAAFAIPEAGVRNLEGDCRRAVDVLGTNSSKQITA